MIRYIKSHDAKRGTSSYSAPGAGTIYLGKAAFNGVHPEFLDIDNAPEAIVKEKAVRGKMTDEQKAEKKAATADVREAKKLEKQIAKMNAKTALLEQRANEARERAAAIAEAKSPTPVAE